MEDATWRLTKNVFHGREALFHGYLEPIPPTKAVVMGENGQPHF